MAKKKPANKPKPKSATKSTKPKSARKAEPKPATKTKAKPAKLARTTEAPGGARVGRSRPRAVGKRGTKRLPPHNEVGAALEHVLSARTAATRERVVPPVVVKRVKGPLPAATWPTEKEWRQSGLCSEAQADGIPCTALGRPCEVCERSDQKETLGG